MNLDSGRAKLGSGLVFGVQAQRRFDLSRDRWVPGILRLPTRGTRRPAGGVILRTVPPEVCEFDRTVVVDDT